MHIRFVRTLMFGLVALSMSAGSFAQIGVAIRIGPPALPVYEQPLCPATVISGPRAIGATITNRREGLCQERGE
jgi:hypothetical protein